MKFNANNRIGWLFSGNTTDFGIQNKVMEYVLKKFNPYFELSPTLSDAELKYLRERIKYPVKSFHWQYIEETKKFDKDLECALVISEAMQRVRHHSVLLDGIQHDRVYNNFKKLWNYGNFRRISR